VGEAMGCDGGGGEGDACWGRVGLVGTGCLVGRDGEWGGDGGFASEGFDRVSVELVDGLV